MKPIARLSDDWPALNALLDEALELPQAKQAAWLDGLHGDDATYRDVLRDLLRHRAEVESVDFLGALPQLGAGDRSEEPTSIASGGPVGPYRLLSEIAHGGMGTVWLAERADGSLQRKVALKLPRVAWGIDFAERLSRESRILESLEHRNIARLYDAGLDAQRRPYLAMEYVEGQPIDVYCRERGLSVRQRIELVSQVAAAVAHAHAKLVVHRDLKPSNILVTRDGEVKLLDFGIAKLLETDVTTRTALTEAAGAALTLDYASPEQIGGMPLGTASDVYSLGVVVYELLANARPYRLKRRSAAEIEEAITNIDPRRASDAASDPASKRQLKGDLDAILNKALKSVDARYPSIEAFARDLERFLGGLPVEARPDSRRYRVGKFVRRHRLALGMGTALAAAIVAGAGVSLWQAREARQQAARAESEVDAQLAVRDLYRETLMALDLAAATDPAALTRKGAIVVALKEKLVEMEPRYQNRPNGRDAQLEAVSTQLNYHNDFEGSLAVGRRYLASLKEHGAPADRIVRAYTTIAKNLFRLKRWDECEAARREAVAWAPNVVDPVTVTARSVAYNDLGSLLISFGKHAEAERILLDGDALMDREFKGGEFTFVPLQLSQLYTGFDEAKALQYARKGHRGALLRPEADADQRGFDLLTLGTALSANGLSAEAESSLHDAHELLLQLFPPGDNGVLRAFNRWVGAVSRQGDYGRAASLLAEKRRTLADLPAGLTPYAELYLDAREADNAWLAGDIARAEIPTPAIPDALVAAAVRTDHDSPLLAGAQLLVLAGRPGEALTLLKRLDEQWPTRGAPTAMWVRLQQVVAIAQSADGKTDDSRKTAGSLRALLEREHATTGVAYRTALELEALAAARLGDLVDATRILALLDGIDPAPPFASPVERAESSLRRAEVLVAVGRVGDSRAAGRSALSDLKAQHPDSPRLAAARHYANVAAA